MACLSWGLQIFETDGTNVKRRTECLTCLYTYYKRLSMKFIKEPLSIVSSALRRTTNLNDAEFLKFSATKGWNFTKTIIPFVLFGYLPSRTQRGLMKSLLNIILRTAGFKMAAVSAKRTAFLDCTFARLISNLVIHRATCCWLVSAEPVKPHCQDLWRGWMD